MKRCFVFPGVSCADAITEMADAGVQLPVVAKPLLTGQPGSHDLMLIRDLQVGLDIMDLKRQYDLERKYPYRAAQKLRSWGQRPLWQRNCQEA